MVDTLADKVAVITGATRGLGLAIAHAYGREGAAVVIASRSTEAVDEAVASLRAEGIQASGRPCDVADLAQVEALAGHAREAFGRLDIWVNNAGTAGIYGPTAHITAEAFTQVLQTNILGVYHGSLVAMRHFVPQGRGKLINVLGMGARRPAPLQNAYGSSKAWVRSFTLALAKEYADSGVGVFAFHPGMMRTAMLQRVDVIAGCEERLKVFETIVRMWANPPEVPARRAVWLASSATDGRTGLEVQATAAFHLLRGALRELWRRLLRRPGEPLEITIRTVPPAKTMD